MRSFKDKERARRARELERSASWSALDFRFQAAITARRIPSKLRKMPVLILLHSVALALSLGPTARPALLPRRCPAPIAQAVSTSLSTVDAAKIFGRLAEKTLYLDATVGACCHSACSDCEWRTPGGGYRWDVMKAQVAKWLPCYLTRDFADERALAFGYVDSARVRMLHHADDLACPTRLDLGAQAAHTHPPGPQRSSPAPPPL